MFYCVSCVGCRRGYETQFVVYQSLHFCFVFAIEGDADPLYIIIIIVFFLLLKAMQILYILLLALFYLLLKAMQRKKNGLVN